MDSEVAFILTIAGITLFIGGLFIGGVVSTSMAGNSLHISFDPIVVFGNLGIAFGATALIRKYVLKRPISLWAWIGIMLVWPLFVLYIIARMMKYIKL